MYAASAIHELLQKLDRRPNKRLGQHFLIDAHKVKKSLALAAIQPGEVVLEIGPGLGILTQALLEAGAEVYAVECDRVLVDYLHSTLLARFPHSFHLLEGDALDHPLGLLPERKDMVFKIVANLPYAISTPWLDAILSRPLPTKLVLMLQAKTAERLTARPGNKQFGAISILLSAAYESGVKAKVSRHCFYPQPKVDSLLLSLNRRQTPFRFTPESKNVIRTLFRQRRKQIGSLCRKNAAQYPLLKEWLDELTLCGVSATVRPETLALPFWKRLDQRFASSLKSDHLQPNNLNS